MPNSRRRSICWRLDGNLSATTRRLSVLTAEHLDPRRSSPSETTATVWTTCSCSHPGFDPNSNQLDGNCAKSRSVTPNPECLRKSRSTCLQSILETAFVHRTCGSGLKTETRNRYPKNLQRQHVSLQNSISLRTCHGHLALRDFVCVS